jgi:hypothetical protein
VAEDEKKRDVRPFVEFLHEQRRGATHVELSEALNKVTEAVVEHGKVGSITLTVKVKPGGDGMVIVEDEIKAKAPEPGRAANIYYVDDDANLQREDPRQQRLPLREVGKEKVRDIKPS